MALNLNKKPAQNEPVANGPAQTTQTTQTTQPQQKTDGQTKAPPANANSGLADLVKQGKAAWDEVQKEDKKAEAASEANNKLFRFRLQEGEERKITFLDGKLDEEGYLDIPVWREHRVKVNGRWTPIVCLSGDGENDQPCPICENGDKPALVGGLTVIDHSPYTIQNGPNAGQTLQNRKQLYAAKRKTLKQLQKIAEKRGGLTNYTFDVSRSDDKSPAVGDAFDEVAQQASEDLIAEFGEAAYPADIPNELTYMSAEQMVEVGVGKPVNQVGGEQPKHTEPSASASTASGQSLEDQL